MWERGIEIDRISRFKDVILHTDVQLQLPAQNRKEFHAGVVMRAGLSWLQRLELGMVSVQLALHGSKVQRFKKERNITPIGPFRETLTLGTPHDSDNVPLLIVGEKILKTNACLLYTSDAADE